MYLETEDLVRDEIAKRKQNILLISFFPLARLLLSRIQGFFRHDRSFLDQSDAH